MSTILILLFFTLDGVLEGWRWTGKEPLLPDRFHPTIGTRNFIVVCVGLLGGLSIPAAIGTCLVGGLVLREMTLNYITRGVLIPDHKQPLMGIKRHPLLEVILALVIGLPLLVL